MTMSLPNPGVANNASSNYNANTIMPALTTAVIQNGIAGSLPLLLNQAASTWTVLEDMFLDTEVIR